MKIKPKIKGPKNYVDYSTLKTGEGFIYQGELWMVVDDVGDQEQIAVCLRDGAWFGSMCGESVLPVDVVVTWVKKPE